MLAGPGSLKKNATGAGDATVPRHRARDRGAANATGGAERIDVSVVVPTYNRASRLELFSSRRPHTRSDRDWSSDVCSSDLYTTLFFFQAEDGIRDLIVTGVQTCALPISRRSRNRDLIVTGVQTCALPI